MMYPFDPEGSPFGPEYPVGFTKWYLVIVLVLLVLGALFLNH